MKNYKKRFSISQKMNEKRIKHNNKQLSLGYVYKMMLGARYGNSDMYIREWWSGGGGRIK